MGAGVYADGPGLWWTETNELEKVRRVNLDTKPQNLCLLRSRLLKVSRCRCTGGAVGHPVQQHRPGGGHSEPEPHRLRLHFPLCGPHE